jgi:hypothetical protein
MEALARSMRAANPNEYRFRSFYLSEWWDE